MEERGVRLIRLWFTDVLGQLKSFAISPAELENALEEGMTFDGSSIDGFSRVQESDVLAMPDPNTFELLPVGRSARRRRPGCSATSRNLDGTPFEGDPRQVLRAQPRPGPRAGLHVLRRPRDGVLLLRAQRRPRPPKPLDEGSYFDLTTADVAGDLRKRTIQTLETMGIPVEYSFHEDSPSQHEIDLRHTDALTMADNVMTFRLVVREAACRRACTPRSCPSRSKACRARACTPTCRLFEGDENAFYDAGDPLQASPRSGKGFIAGLLAPRHARSPPITNQTVNSYKRLIPGFEAPVYVSWARNNRSALVRVPIAKSKAASTRIEYRAPDPACNPYLAFSVMLAAGLEGHRGGLRAADARRPATSSSSPPRSGPPKASTSCRSRCPRPSTRWSSPSSSPRRWASTSSSGSCATSDRSGSDYKTQVTPFELDRYLRNL